MPRRKLPIDPRVVGQMALQGCANTEIASLIGCDEGTIRKRFSDILEKNRARRRWNLRKGQNKLANRGNATMLIWLGKNELDQTDKQNLSSDGKLSIEVVYRQLAAANGNGHVNGNGNGHARCLESN